MSRTIPTPPSVFSEGPGPMKTIPIDEVRLVVPSRIESLAVINAVAEEVAQQLDFDEETRNAITISVVEAGTNAIQHGNREDSSKPTEVLFRTENGKLIIPDPRSGSGFDPSLAGEPLAGKRIVCRARSRRTHLAVLHGRGGLAVPKAEPSVASVSISPRSARPSQS
mgnify:CR=1 FL=1